MKHVNSEHQTVSALAITLVKVGIVITIPAFLVGSQILQSLGLAYGIVAILIGSFCVAALASSTMYLASKTHLSTYQLSNLSFGSAGSRIVSGVIGMTLLGWFAITVNLFGDIAEPLTRQMGIDVPHWLYITLMSALATVTVMYGFHALELFSRFATPLLGLLLLGGVFLVLRKNGINELNQVTPKFLPGLETIGRAVSALIGAFMVAITIAPDFARFARTPKTGIQAAWLSYALFGALVLIGAGLPGLAVGQEDLIGGFSSLGLGLVAFILIFFATWTTNSGNLYSSTLAAVQSLDLDRHVKPLTICLGFLGIAMALWFNLDSFGRFLQLLAISIPPIAGVYLCDGLIFGFSDDQNAKWVPRALISWGLGILLGSIATFTPAHFLPIPALTSLVSAFAFQFCLTKFSRRANEKL